MYLFKLFSCRLGTKNIDLTRAKFLKHSSKIQILRIFYTAVMNSACGSLCDRARYIF